MTIFFICLFASIIGSICGIGGGVIIKPLLDATSSLNVEAISFLSGFTVLCMSSYTVLGNMFSHESTIDSKRVIPIALGAVVGGITGKIIFQLVASSFENNVVGMTQSASLLIICVGTLIYSINKDKIVTKNIESKLISIFAGLVLGILSSFLGIGGGPFNLIILSYLFSMDTKVGAQSSLYIILFSQISSILLVIATNSVPTFETSTLLLMAVGGIGGGIVGRRLNKFLSDKAVNKLFSSVNVLIILICIYNVYNLIG